MRQRMVAGLLATALGGGLFMTGAPRAQAGSEGRKNTAIGLGAVAAYELLRGEGTKGLIAGAAAAYAYKRYQDARKAERYRYGYYRGSRYVGSSNRAVSHTFGLWMSALDCRQNLTSHSSRKYQPLPTIPCSLG